MLHELIEKHGNGLPIVIDIMNIGVASKKVSLFDPAYRDRQVVMKTPNEGISYNEIVQVMKMNHHIFSLVTFELLEGPVEIFGKLLSATVRTEDSNGTCVTIPINPDPVLESDGRIRYFDGHFAVDKFTDLFVNVPNASSVRVKLYQHLNEEVMNESPAPPPEPSVFSIRAWLSTKTVVDIIHAETDMNKEQAADFALKVGLYSIVHHPVGIEWIDQQVAKYPELVAMLKQVDKEDIAFQKQWALKRIDELKDKLEKLEEEKKEADTEK